MSAETVDLAVVGAGAAGLMTSISAARHAPQHRVVCVDGARTIGAKILVSGGGRCNVTNREVTERDFWGGPSRVVRDVLRAFPASRAVALFDELGVALHEEEDAKLFPDSHRARTVLDALLAEAARLRVEVRPGHRVEAITQEDQGFMVVTSRGSLRAHAVALATGGQSLPKSGSDGYGFELAVRLGHTIVPTTPALVPLLLNETALRALSGVAHPATVSVRTDGTAPVRLTGSLLWTHFGASGPVVLNASRHWHRATLEERAVRVSVSLVPGRTFEELDRVMLDAARDRPRMSAAMLLTSLVPASVAGVWLGMSGVGRDVTMAHLSRDERRALVHALLDTPLDVRGSRGYTYAEVTAGGVPLGEIDPATMESRRCPNLFIVGEILDVDGRIGGFNFQWAWSTGWIAGKAIAQRMADSSAR